MNREDITGKKFGRLTVVRLSSVIKNHVNAWECRCDCGAIRYLTCGRLKSGVQVSCGCYGRENNRAVHTTHGMTNSPEWGSWRGMIDRCTNVGHVGYKFYGGRGIKICPRWRKFENFFRDMGKRPSGHSLDRIDSSKGYSPTNCRWATTTQQRENRKDLIWVSVDGEVMTLTSACRKLGKIYSTVHSRIYKAGKTPQEAIAA